MKKQIGAQQHKQKKWCFYSEDKEKVSLMAQKLNIPEVVARVLLNRGINTVEKGQEFLNPNLSRLHSPFLMKDMDRAVDAITKTRQQGQKIAIYGDYDVDGITATALLYSLLQQLGADPLFYIPNRLTEGYGLNKKALHDLKNQGVSLIITVDCGISDREELDYAQELEMEVIVTDHHQPPEILPPAVALLNPLRPGCCYPFKALCGAGIAFKLGQALTGRANYFNILSYLDLAAVGTVADMVPLVGENRIIVAEGLKAMAKSLRPGLSALCQVAGLKHRQLTAEEIAFVLAPRLNAAGRLGSPSRSLSLLLETDFQVALETAKKLQQENYQRQKMETEITGEASQMAEVYLEEGAANNFLLLAREGWHPGVLGIVANRVAEKYNLPVILISLEGGLGKGSGRSAGNFDLISALQQCSAFLEDYGGHQAAVGLTINAKQIPFLREKLNLLARDFFKDSSPVPGYYIDSRLNPEEITPGLVRLLEALEPFGHGNPRPLFYGQEWLLAQKKEVGKGGRHLKLTLNKNKFYFTGISFNAKNRLPAVIPGRRVDFLFTVTFDRWRGGNALQLEVYYFFYNDEFSNKNLLIVNCRNLGKKIPYLQELLRTGEKVLVFVNTVRQLERLKDDFSDFPNIFFTHQGELSEFTLSQDLMHLLLYDLPLRETKLVKALRHLLAHKQEGAIFRLHLLYGEKDFYGNLKLLRATVPSLPTLEYICLSLEEIAVGESIDLRDVYLKLPGMLPFPATRHLLKRSMVLLEKACYLKKNDNELLLQRGKTADYCALFNNIRILDDFCREKERWKKTLFWQRYLLKAPGEEIAQKLV